MRAKKGPVVNRALYILSGARGSRIAPPGATCISHEKKQYVL